ncbi:MAG TPA: SprT family zinc-dependent metalloprotease [Abditibacterium sp.]|jgi:hypothetical protein
MIKPEGSGFVLCYGGLELPFHIETKKRKNLSIAVSPDRSLSVIAPLEADLETVLKRIDGRASWIAKQWRAFATSAENLEGLGYFAGETHWYLGRAYRLKIRPPHAGEKEGVALLDRFLWVVAPDRKDAARIERLLEGWYRQRAHETFALWLQKCLSNARSLAIETAPPLEIRKMQKRWGSCTKSGKILLNLDLVKAPVDCLEYVLFHELCHLQIAHHGPEFYRLLSRFLPDWKERKAKLEEWGKKI